MKRKWIYWTLLCIVFIVLVVLEYTKPKKIDWNVSFSRFDKIPYGTYCLYNVISDIFPDNIISENRKTLYNFFNQHGYWDTTNMIFINRDFNIKEPDLTNLLDFVRFGNTAFISASFFSREFEDSLNFKAAWNFNTDSINTYFANPILRSNNNYFLSQIFEINYLKNFDSTNVTVLGYCNKDFVNFVRVPYGDGYFYLHLQPFIFTNYYFLKNKNYEYAAKALSYLPKRNTCWDEYYKAKQNSDSDLLRVIKNDIALLWAFRILLFGLILYALFQGKRRQRIIPIIKEFSNTSLEFIETLGRLYLHTRNHKDIALKKFQYMLDFIRNQYYMNLSIADTDNYETIGEKTGVDRNLIAKIFKQAQIINEQKYITSEFLSEFSRNIEFFYKSCK